MSEIVSTNWLYKNINNKNLVILDCSWHMPIEKRNGGKEFKKMHIKNAYFFDIDKNQRFLLNYLQKFDKKLIYKQMKKK